jgi:hypothetical protein
MWLTLAYTIHYPVCIPDHLQKKEEQDVVGGGGEGESMKVIYLILDLWILQVSQRVGDRF